MNHMHEGTYMTNASKPITEFDFDAWLKLAQSDPASFEQKRRQEINGLIEKMSCRDDLVHKIRARIERQRNNLPSQEVLPWMMQELSEAFSQLNAEFEYQAAHWPE